MSLIFHTALYETALNKSVLFKYINKEQTNN